MAKILCATRGGEASYKTQDAAIALALEQEVELLFLFVVDIDFLSKTERAVRREIVTQEMDHMAEFILMMAIERARKKEVKSSLLIRHGQFREELIDTAKDPEVVGVVLGKPAGEDSLFSMEGLENIAKDIEQKSNAKVYIL
jgi:hypothetical protein